MVCLIEGHAGCKWRERGGGGIKQVGRGNSHKTVNTEQSGSGICLIVSFNDGQFKGDLLSFATGLDI